MKIDHPNLTLEFLQKMTREEAMVYFRRGKSINLKQLMMSVILAASRIHWSDTRGVREFWYNPLKPILYKILGRNETDTGRKYDNFNYVLSSMVKEGVVTYKSLGIVDFRTLRELYEYEIEGNCWRRVILFVEKDAAYHHLQPLKDLLNITILSGGGVSKTACAESIIDNLDSGFDYSIFVVTDYDPWGFYIGKEVSEKFETLGLSVKETHRIAVNPEQIDGGILDNQMYPVKMDDKAPSWCEKYGLGPNKEYGFEIEAISGQPGGGQQLRMIVLEALLEHLDEYSRIWELTEDKWDMMAYDTWQWHIDSDTLSWSKQYKLPVPLTQYLTEDQYTEGVKSLEESLAEDTADWGEELENVEETIAELEDERSGEIGSNYAKYERQIEELDEKYLQPLRDELKRLEELHIGPLKNERDDNEDAIRSIYTVLLTIPREERRSLDRKITIRSGQHDLQVGLLGEDYHKSRAIFADSISVWLYNNIEQYTEKGKTDMNFSFGLIEGCLIQACVDGIEFKDMKKIVDDWDVEMTSSYIIDDMEVHHMDEIEDRIQKMVKKCLEMKEE